MMKYLNKLLGDEEIAGLLGSEKDIEAMVRFELALLRAHYVHGIVSQTNFQTISSHLAVFRLDDHSLIDATLRDGIVVPDLVAQMRAHLPEALRQYLHFGVSSQDVVDTAFAVKMIPVFRILEDRLANILTEIDDLVGRLTQRNHGQNSIPAGETGDAVNCLLAWRGPLERAFESLYLEEQALLILSLQYGDATSDRVNGHLDNIRYMVAEELGVTVPDYQPHSQRDRIVRFGSWLAQVSAALGKVGQDIVTLVQKDTGHISFQSADPQTGAAVTRPSVRAEVLVTLAQFNAVCIGGLHQAMLQASDRTRSAWSLEWMILPQMIETTATALTHARDLIGMIDTIRMPAASH
jgi:3-carboxy-cis,cis-muconate cycloisomerase